MATVRYASPGPENFSDEPINERSEELEAHMSFVDQGIERNRQRSRTGCVRVCILGIPLLFGLSVACFVLFANHTNRISNLTQDPSTFVLPPPPHDLASRCSSIDEAREDCEEACEVAECCDFPSNLPLSCLQGNEDTCLQYHKHCQVLEDEEKKSDDLVVSVPPAPANLRSVCELENILTVNGFQECHGECSHATCCFDKSVTTCDHKECLGYAPCLSLTAASTTHEAIPKHVEKACANDNLETEDGRSKCRQSCLHALCCFSDDPAQICPHHDDSFCEQYAACDMMEKNAKIRATATEIANSCNGDLPQMKLCEAECERGACCFSKEGCTKLYPDNVCTHYEPCKKLFISQP